MEQKQQFLKSLGLTVLLSVIAIVMAVVGFINYPDVVLTQFKGSTMPGASMSKTLAILVPLFISLFFAVSSIKDTKIAKGCLIGYVLNLILWFINFS